VTTTTATAGRTPTSRSEVSVRPAVPADAESIATIHHLGWTRTYRGLLPDAYLDTLSYDACLARWTSVLAEGSAVDVLVAEVGGRVVGFVTAGASADPDATAAGEIWDLWVDAASRSQGVGTHLLAAALDGLAARHRAALVWVLDVNARGRAFYAREGAVRDGLSRTSDIPGGRMTDVRFLWDLRGRLPGSPSQTG
jgi:ribosomal protein S18 acetylase RimI-like enzyme